MKETIINIIRRIILGMMYLLPHVVYGNQVTIGKIKYELSNGTANVIGLGDGVESVQNLYIPTVVKYEDDNYIVKSIRESAFTSNDNISGTLHLPENLIYIGDSAFENCQFSGTLVLPDSLQNIGSKAFYGCSNFTGALRIPDSVENIGNLAFYGCSGFDGELTIGNAVKRICHAAFANCKFRGSLIIPNSVTIIDESAFSGCSEFNGNLILGNSITIISKSALKNCSGLHGSLIIPESTNTIEPSAFYNCSNLDGVLILPESITTIGGEAFYNCSNLTGDLKLPSSIKEIAASTFAHCSGLNGTLTIPKNITKIGELAFYGCSGLTGDLLIPNTVESIRMYAFMNCSSFNGILHIPEDLTEIMLETFSGCSNLKGDLSIPSKVTYIGEGAFGGCSSMTGCLIIPEAVKEVGRMAFAGCSGFSSIKINARLAQINESTFRGCTGIRTVKIPNSVELIAYRAFQDVPADSIILPASLKEIYASAFYGKMPKMIVCEATIPPATITGYEGYCVFNSYVGSEDYEVYYEKVPLYVPIESIEKYKSQGEWQWFKNIYGIGEAVAESITLNHEALTLKVKQEANLIATILPETTTDKSVTWKSSDEAIATVDVNGRVTAVAVGKATITATAESGISAECSITVIETPAGGIIIDKDALGITGDNLEMRVGDVKAIKVTITPETTTDKSVTYESSSPSVARVDEHGNVTALSLGKTTIIITAKSNPEVKAAINVTVVATPAASITLNKTAVTLKAPETVDLVANILPETTTDKSVTWKSSNEAIATVDSNGKVTAVAVGKAATIRVNETVQLNVTITPEQTTDKTVVWESSDDNIASVDASGLVTGLYSGVVTITATAASRVSTSCRVTVLPRETAPITVTRSEELMIIMDGETAEMSVSVTGGYPEGLSFTWSNGGNIVGTANSLRVVGRSNGNEKSNEFYSVRIVDVCDGVTLIDQIYQFEVETWPLPSSDVIIETGTTGNNVKIREGNLLELSSDTPEGGYGDNWSFEWYLDGDKISTEPEMRHKMTMASGVEMATAEAVVTLSATNFGPDGTVWGEAISAPVNVTVYRRPLTPKQLLRKGDGTSHTLVAMAQYNDGELARLGYEFVYGYTDATGEDHIVAATGKRYCRIDENVFNNATCEKWCYSQWTYADGSVVTSGKRYLDGRVDDDFDGSDFSGNVRNINAIDFSDSNNWIQTSSRGVSIVTENETDTKVEIFTISGLEVTSIVIPGGEYSSMEFTTSNVASGMYVVVVTSGGTRVAKKVLIK